MKKVFIRGNNERGSEVIKMLKVLGGVNSLCLKGADDSILYYINTYNNIDHALLESKVGIIIQECFEELHLPPEPNKELPNTWEEWVEQNKKVYSEYYMAADNEVYNIKERERNINSDGNLLSKEKDAKAILVLIKLKRLRDTYRQGWVPDWKNNSEIKYCIEYKEGILVRCGHTNVTRFLSFQTLEIRDKFYENFKSLIEQAKEFILMKKIEKEIREAMGERTKKFLKQQKCLLRFIHNCIEFPLYRDTFGNPDYKRTLDILTKDNCPMINCFCWSQTPEQWKFWNEIDDCWINRFL